MARQDTPKRIEHMKGFLIRRLFAVMVFVLISESLVNVMLSQVVFPTLSDYYGLNAIFASQDFASNMILAGKLMLYFILTGLSSGLPFLASSTVSYFLEKNLLAGVDILTSIPDERKPAIFIAMFFITCIYVVPYVVGILYYSGLVVKNMELVRAYDRRQREEFTRKRNLLLSDITHDLKTPITTIAGYSQALNDGMVKDPEKQKAYLEAIHHKSLEMSELITMLFNYVKMDSEGFSLKLEKHNMSQLVLQIVAGAYTDIEEAGMELDVDIPEEEIPAKLDQVQFTRSIKNLVTNAIKHNDAGTKIKVSITDEWSSWNIRVADSGQPIDEALRETIFDPFVMGDESRNRRGGSGLGLSITRKVIEMHGGRISIEQPTEAPYTKAFCVRIPKMNDYEYGSGEGA